MIMKRTLAWLLTLILFIQVTACGTLLYPERRGQSAEGGIDIVVALLDGAGLFFGLVPGVIAFAVDLSTGAIYLPAGRHASLAATTNPDSNSAHVSFDERNYHVVQVSQDHLDQAAIAQIIYQETGKQVNLNSEDLQLIQLDDLDQLEQMFDQYN